MCNTVRQNNTRPSDTFNDVVQSLENPSLLLYAFVVYAILRNRKQFKNAFFTICISLALGDFMFVAVQKTISLLQIWTDRFTALMLVAQWSPALLYAGVQMLVPQLGVLYTVHALIFVHPVVFGDLIIFLSAYEACFALAMCVAYAHMVVALYKNSAHGALVADGASGGAGGKLKKREVKLTLLGAVLTGSMLAKQTRSVIFFLQLNGVYANDSVQAIVAQRIFNYSNPYFLLYTSAMVRKACWKELLRLFCCKVALVSVASTSTHRQPSQRRQQTIEQQ